MDILSRISTPRAATQTDQQRRQDYGVVDDILRHLKPFYTHPDIEEIVINRPGELWVKRRRPSNGEKLWGAIQAGELDFGYLERVCRVVANANNEEFGPEENMRPTVYAALPGGHRFTAAMYKRIVYDEVTPQGGVAMAIRQAPRGDSTVTYADYGLERGVRLGGRRLMKPLTERAPDDYEKLRRAIDEGHPLIISGATSTGKTTLLNQIISDLDRDLRIITLEDTRELFVPHANRFHIILSRTSDTAKFNDAAAINLMTRMTPDVILCGEVSTNNAATIWELTGSGHGSMMTTIHADNPEQALRTFTERMRHTNPNIQTDELIRQMRKRFTVVQIERDHAGKRRITAVETFGK